MTEEVCVCNVAFFCVANLTIINPFVDERKDQLITAMWRQQCCAGPT